MQKKGPAIWKTEQWKSYKQNNKEEVFKNEDRLRKLWTTASSLTFALQES